MTELCALLVEDSEADAALLTRELRRGGFAVASSRVDTAPALRSALDEGRWDVVFADYTMPSFDAFAALQIVRAHDPDVPFIIVSGTIGEDRAVAAMKAGAHDYLIKGNLARLVPAVERELREAEVRRERRRADESLRETNRRLEAALDELKRTQQRLVQQERMQALQHLAGGVVHDVMNLLTPILSFTDWLLSSPEKLDEREQVVRRLRMINLAAQDVSRVVGRLRQFYKPRTETRDSFTAVDLGAVVQDAVELTRPEWGGSGKRSSRPISIETDLRHCSIVEGDPSELRELLTNLILNAVDAMPSGGRLTVQTLDQGSRVVLRVIDTGVGMTADVLARCMEPLFTTKGEKGTGLGLAIVYGIVQRHGGDIDIDSKLDSGTTVMVELPAASFGPYREPIRS